MLGSGSFGEVYKGIADPDGFLFAAKKVPLTDAQKVSSIEHEIDLLCQLHHEHIVEYFGTKREEANLYVFLEFVNGGSLDKVYREFPLNDSQVSYYTKQIPKGLEYLHEQNVVHGDIKCANLLLNENGVVKIADFGLAKVSELKNLRKSGRGTPAWCAHEVIDLTKYGGFGLEADIWSLGCTVLEMLTKEHPYCHLEPWTIWYWIGEGRLPSIPDYLSADSQDFILKCLLVNPKERPTTTSF
ncbi:LOW QUALITY PROTEIN: mitogen-activated protein kinase kinase kinase 1-like [Jatropha curcas]|uniref:LOW QUALITY PROTEIN: mitogen-activated protein kinase kinase kinase 1-like n=1 Tax=Jatropha curcas TaxID=180498 RepID=UPI0018934988|nr:LOW QUALITY PROTEIN: mitogen-activated protein kinase kinase kinase 1-like [Jatropha curcas]